jgi:choline dehydrogenase-like flavoprotein
MHGRPVAMQAQPYFVLPLASLHGSGRVDAERLHTLAQLFVELIDAGLSAHPIHLQIYTYNEFIRERLARATAVLGPLGAIARRAVAGRLLAVQGYLHSSEGPGIQLTLAANGADRPRLMLSAGADDRARAVIAGASAALARHGRRLGLVPLNRFLEVGRPGDGNHVGGTFPMSAAPGDLRTDRLGRLDALPGVHLIDSSVLPSLAATTFTYTTMANAHRIADAVADGA